MSAGQSRMRRGAVALAFTLALAWAPAARAADRLVVHYPLTQVAGTVVSDISGNDRAAAVVGDGTWRGAEGLQLGGTNGHVALPNDLLRDLTAVTVSIDVLVAADQATPYFIWGMGNPATGASGTGMLFTTGNAYRTAISPTYWNAEQNLTSGSNLARGVWKTLTYTLSGGTAVLYLDGAEVARRTGVTITPAQVGGGTTTANYIGRSMYSTDRYLKGSVRDFRLYDHALTAAEISSFAIVSDAVRAARDAAALSLPATAASNLALPTSGPNGATIAWASSDPAVISNTGVVTLQRTAAIVTLTATATRGAASEQRTFTVTVPADKTDAEKAAERAAALKVWDADDVRGNLALDPVATWRSSDPAVVSDTGEVTRGEQAKAVTLTATVRVGEATVERSFALTVRAKPKAEPREGYAFAYFTGEGTASGEQIYFAASRGNDPTRWDEINGGNPVLTSTLGDKGVRDPFIIRSPEGDKLFLIATDLRIYGNGNWDAAQRSGSKYIEVWESTDLVHWGEQRHVKVSPDTAGNTWAPEAFYDDALGAYVVYWASKIYADDDPGHTGNTYNKMMYATTRDFRSFSEPKVWIDPGYSVIDSTVIKHDGVYYRFTKDERNNTSTTPCSKFIFEQKATSLLDLDWDFVAECVGKANADGPGVSQGEGPTIFKSNTEDRWYLLIDEFGGRGYVPFESTDLASGAWKLASGWELPSRPRHGTVLPVTKAELKALRDEPDPLSARADGLIASYAGSGRDTSGNGHDATLSGDVSSVDGALLFGGTNGYLKLPDNVLAGLAGVTVAAQVWIDPSQATPYMIWGLGNSSGASGNGYLFTTGDGLRGTISRSNWTGEQNAAGTGNLARGGWHQLTYTVSGSAARLYLDGVEVGRNDAVIVRPGDIGLGRTTANYIGRSLSSADRYFKGQIKGFSIWNRALSLAEILKLPSEVEGGVGGTVPPTLSLTLGAPASFGPLTPGVTKEYTATTTANVISSADDAALTVADPGHLSNGAFSLSQPLRVDISPGAWAGPVSNTPVAITFKQLVNATDPLRTGAYSRTVTFTLSTTMP